MWTCDMHVFCMCMRLTCELHVPYHIVGNFRGRKLSRIARFCCAKGRHTPNFTEKTFAYSHKTAKFAKVFSLESFPLYGTVP